MDGTLFYGSPCLAVSIGGALQREVIPIAIGGALVVGFGVLNWRIRSRQNGRLLVEITAEGIRVRDDGPMVPWSAVTWVGFARVGGGGTVAPSRALVLHLVDGGKLHHVFDGVRIEGIHGDVRAAISRFAPQVPVSDDDKPPPGVP